MKYLLDTTVWLWSVGASQLLNQAARDILSSGQAEVYFSAASSWEIATKAGLGKLEMPEAQLPSRYVPKRLNEQGIRPLMITLPHALAVYELPMLHKDPFDRLLIAQAKLENMTILTADRIFQRYEVQVMWCGR